MEAGSEIPALPRPDQATRSHLACDLAARESGGMQLMGGGGSAGVGEDLSEFECHADTIACAGITLWSGIHLGGERPVPCQIKVRKPTEGSEGPGSGAFGPNASAVALIWKAGGLRGAA